MEFTNNIIVRDTLDLIIFGIPHYSCILDHRGKHEPFE